MQYLTSTTDVTVELESPVNGNVFAYGLYNDGLGGVSPTEAAIGLVENLDDIDVNLKDIERYVIGVYRGERLEGREQIADLLIYGSSLVGSLVSAIDGGDEAQFYLRHASVLAEIGSELYMIEDQNSQGSGIIRLPLARDSTAVPERNKSFSPSLVVFKDSRGTIGNDVIIGQEGVFSEVFVGGPGQDMIFGLDGHDRFIAGPGDHDLDGDVFFGNNFADRSPGFDLGGGDDTVDYSLFQAAGIAASLNQSSEYRLNRSPGYPALQGLRASAYWFEDGDAYGPLDYLYSIENLIGTKWGDVLEGSVRNNVLTGGSGADILVGTRGNDSLFGGVGFDVADYGQIEAVIRIQTIDANSGKYEVKKVFSDGSIETDQLTGIERIASNEQQANTYTENIQRQSSAAKTDDGFVIIWVSQEHVQGQSISVVGRRFDSNGHAVGSEFLVSSNVGSGEWETHISPTSDGGFIAVWQGRNDDRELKTFARLFRGDGSPEGTEFEVFPNPDTGDARFDRDNSTQEQAGYSVATLADGNILIVSRADGHLLDSPDILARVVDTSSGSSGSAGQLGFVANAKGPSGWQFDPSCAAMANGGFIVSWTQYDGSGQGVFAQLFDADYGAVGGAIHLNAGNPQGNQTGSSVAGLRDGGYVAVWTDTGITDGRGDISLKHVGPNGAVVLDSIIVNDNFQDGSQADAHVTALEDGGYLVSWRDRWPHTDGRASAVVAQQFDVLGQRVGDNFVVNVDHEGEQYASESVALPGGDYVVTWTSEEEIRYRHYTNQGGDAFGPIIGSQLDEVFEGTARDEVFRGKGGSDFINGGDGNDRIFGNKGSDLLRGGDGNDRIKGGMGDDLIVDGRGLDRVYGNAGADNFEFVADATKDVINDFADGIDLITLKNLGFSDLTLMDVFPGKVEIKYGEDVLILKDGGLGLLTVADITADDFLFT